MLLRMQQHFLLYLERLRHAEGRLIAYIAFKPMTYHVYCVVDFILINDDNNAVFPEADRSNAVKPLCAVGKKQMLAAYIPEPLH